MPLDDNGRSEGARTPQHARNAARPTTQTSRRTTRKSVRADRRPHARESTAGKQGRSGTRRSAKPSVRQRGRQAGASARAGALRPRAAKPQRTGARPSVAQASAPALALPSHTVLIAGAAAIVIVGILVFVLMQCSGSAQADDAAHEAANAEPVQEEQVSALDDQTRSELAEMLGDEYADKFEAAAQSDPDMLWIASHLDEYGAEGEAVRDKMLKLAANEPEAVPTVREYPEKYPADDQADDASLGMPTASPSRDVPDTDIPHLYQWDRRWAQTVYCSTMFGLTGCGPTSLAMIYQGLTGSDDLTPYDLGLMAQQWGYMQQYDGTDYGFFTNVAYELGLQCETLDVSAEAIASELEAGRVIIINLAPGYFTQYGHYFVLAGLDDDGKVIVNDPYSVVRSSQTWDADFLASESRLMFSYWL